MRTEGWARTCLGEEDHFELGNMPVLDLTPFRLISSQCPALFYTTVGLTLAGHNPQAFTLTNSWLGLTNEITDMRLECWKKGEISAYPTPYPPPPLWVVSPAEAISPPWISPVMPDVVLASAVVPDFSKPTFSFCPSCQRLIVAFCCC